MVGNWDIQMAASMAVLRAGVSVVSMAVKMVPAKVVLLVVLLVE